MAERCNHSLLAVLLCTLLVTACDSSPPPQSASRPASPSGPVSESRAAGPDDPPYLSRAADIKASRRWKIAYVMKTEEEGNPYWPRVREGAEQAARDFGVDVSVEVPHKERYDIALQVDLVERLAESDIDGMVIVPIDTNVLAAPVEKFVAGGKPVVVHDTPLNSSAVLTQLAFDNHEAARLVGQWVNRRLGGRGRVLILEGQQESQNAVERRNGFLDGLSEGEIEVLDIRTANWLKREAAGIVSEWLNQFDRIDAILAANDAMALGAAEVVAAAGRGGIVITGVDATRQALRAIRDGRMHATVEQAPEAQARQAVQLLIRHLENGETYPPRSVWRDSPLVTRANVADHLR